MSLKHDTPFNYLYIDMNMCVSNDFDPIDAANHWMSIKKRRSKSSEKAKYQEWFVGVFKQAKGKIRKNRTNNIAF